MKNKFYAEGHNLPKCVNPGCDKYVVVRDWKNWSIKSECSRCANCRIKNLPFPEGITQHKKTYCENDGHLDFECPIKEGQDLTLFGSALDLDHIDGDHFNNVPENVKTYCKMCHNRKSIEAGDTNSHKKSARKIE